MTSRWTLGESITVRVYRLAGGAGNQEREARKSQKHNWSTLGGTLCVTQTPSQLCCTYSNVHWTPTVHPRTHLIRASFTAPSLSPPPTHTHTCFMNPVAPLIKWGQCRRLQRNRGAKTIPPSITRLLDNHDEEQPLSRWKS